MAGLNVPVIRLFIFQIIVVDTLNTRQKFTEKYYAFDLKYYNLILKYL
jgi:hypothetical protein